MYSRFKRVSGPEATEARARRDRRRLLSFGVLRALGSAALVITVYFVAPLDRLESVAPPITLLLALIILTAVVAGQVRAIVQTPFPGIRAVEALAICVPLFLVLFAAGYYLMSKSDSGAFSEPLDRLAGLYYSVTVFATVGFGDITAVTTPARVSTTIQMTLDLIVVGLGARVVLGAVRRSRDEHSAPPSLLEQGTGDG